MDQVLRAIHSQSPPKSRAPLDSLTEWRSDFGVPSRLTIPSEEEAEHSSDLSTQFESISIGIFTGLVSIFLGWLLVRVYFRPRFSVVSRTGPTPVDWVVAVSNRRGRTVIDMTVTCSLRIQYHPADDPTAEAEHDFSLKVPESSFPFVPRDWSRDITISLETGDAHALREPLLLKRLREVDNTIVSLDQVPSLLIAMDKLKNRSAIEVAVSACDWLTGVRTVEPARLEPPSETCLTMLEENRPHTPDDQT